MRGGREIDRIAPKMRPKYGRALFIPCVPRVPCAFGQGVKTGGEMEASSFSDAGVQPTSAERAVPRPVETRGREWALAVGFFGWVLFTYAAIGFGLYELLGRTF